VTSHRRQGHANKTDHASSTWFLLLEECAFRTVYGKRCAKGTTEATAFGLDKPAAIMGASPGELGSARAQSHLRQILVSLDVHTVNEPEVIIANAASRFDVTPTLVDQTSIDLIRQLLQRLAAWTYRLQAENSAKTLRPAV
jgi:hypothetical protein